MLPLAKAIRMIFTVHLDATVQWNTCATFLSLKCIVSFNDLVSMRNKLTSLNDKVPKNAY